MNARKPSAARRLHRHIMWLAKWKAVGEAFRVGDRVMSRGPIKWLGTVSEKHPHGGCSVIYDHCGSGGGGAPAMGCMHKVTGEHVPRRVVAEIVAARARWSKARGFCKHDTAITRILDAYFASLGRAERRPRGYAAWPFKSAPAGREAARHAPR